MELTIDQILSVGPLAGRPLTKEERDLVRWLRCCATCTHYGSETCYCAQAKETKEPMAECSVGHSKAGEHMWTFLITLLDDGGYKRYLERGGADFRKKEIPITNIDFDQAKQDRLLERLKRVSLYRKTRGISIADKAGRIMMRRKRKSTLKEMLTGTTD